MEVRLVCALPSSNWPERDYVRVQTYADPFDDTVVLATIERIVDKARDGDASIIKRVKTLVMRRPMSADDALVLATSYAERKKIAVVYAEQT